MADTFVVSSAQDSGDATFRAAIEAANINPAITEIRFNVSEPIQLLSAIQYLGQQSLVFVGQGVQIDGSQLVEGDLLVTKTGASLTFYQMTFNQSPNRMITVRIPTETVGEVSVLLQDVTIRRAGREALYIADHLVLENNVFVGAPASIKLTIINGVFSENGLKDSGSDGVRVIEFGEGDVVVDIRNSVMNGNGDDGLDLAENDAGDMDVYAQQLSVNNNGAFDTNNAEDGIDIDEAGSGNFYLVLKGAQVNNSSDEGLDLDESGDGHMIITLRDIESNNNGDESVRIDESGAGHIDALLFNVTSNNNGDDGMQIRESNAGRISLNFIDVNANKNEKYGIRIGQFTDNDEIDPEENLGQVLNGGGITVDENALGTHFIQGVIVR